MTRHRPFLLALCLALLACGDDDANASVDQDLCGEERDPHDIFCGQDRERIDSTRALALLREAYPSAQIYSMRGGGGGGTLNVDGEDHQWDFWLTDANGKWLSAGVTARGDVHADELEDASCDGAAFEPLDSRRAVHQALAAFDDRVGMFTHGNIFLSEDTCGFEGLPETHLVIFYPRVEDAALDGTYYGRFRRDHSFIDLVGPCLWPNTLEDCLAGVVVEPEE